jgi:hypothetical protein
LLDLKKETIAAFCAEFIADIPETDPGKLAALVGDAYDGFLDVTAGRPGGQEVRYHGGLTYDLARLACVLLGEPVIHGYDMATALGQPWPIDPVHAQLILYGYGPLYGQCLNLATTAGLCASYGIEVRGGGSLTVSFVDGHYQLAEGISGSVDCEISADPVASSSSERDASAASRPSPSACSAWAARSPNWPSGSLTSSCFRRRRTPTRKVPRFRTSASPPTVRGSFRAAGGGRDDGGGSCEGPRREA